MIPARATRRPPGTTAKRSSGTRFYCKPRLRARGLCPVAIGAPVSISRSSSASIAETSFPRTTRRSLPEAKHAARLPRREWSIDIWLRSLFLSPDRRGNVFRNQQPPLPARKKWPPTSTSAVTARARPVEKHRKTYTARCTRVPQGCCAPIQKKMEAARAARRRAAHSATTPCTQVCLRRAVPAAFEPRLPRPS